MQFRLLIAVFLLFVFTGVRPAAGQQKRAGHGWPVASPASVGLDVKPLNELDAEIRSGKFGYVDGIIVIRHGKLVFDRSYTNDYSAIYGADAKTNSGLNSRNPGGPYNYFNSWWHPYYRRGDLHTLQSVTKTITSMIIGVAVTRGEFPSIDTPVLKFFDEKKVANVDDRKRKLTIRHLLTMTDGIDWDESLPYNDPKNSATLLEASDNWVAYTINRPMMREPGTVFNYNSGASQTLSHIFREATGQDLEEYAAKHLFAPLGIDNWFWKREPEGLADTEGGLYLRPHDLAKLWQLFLNRGTWNGKRVVSEAWVNESVKPAVQVGNSTTRYGLKWWLYPYGPNDPRTIWGGSGFGGQMPMAFLEYDLIVVATGWNILPDRPALRRSHVAEQVLKAVTKPGSGK